MPEFNLTLQEALTKLSEGEFIQRSTHNPGLYVTISNGFATILSHSDWKFNQQYIINERHFHNGWRSFQASIEACYEFE